MKEEIKHFFIIYCCTAITFFAAGIFACKWYRDRYTNDLRERAIYCL